MATTVTATTAPDSAPDTEAVPVEGALSEEGNFGEPTPALKMESTIKPDQGWSEENELAKFNFVRDEMYKSAKEQDSRIVEYESAIRRPYFHVKPLDEAQLANWHRYLDFTEKEGDLAKVSLAYCIFLSLYIIAKISLVNRALICFLPVGCQIVRTLLNCLCQLSGLLDSICSAYGFRRKHGVCS